MADVETVGRESYVGIDRTALRYSHLPSAESIVVVSQKEEATVSQQKTKNMEG